ncbi:hypothetical protein [Haloarcula laminariae]|uniref:hypothetical protein n=1 Tax=Haloarcula laminariae TaxID=2961577 RepID=UPI0021C709C4|nr:hypothetical protein [Halomicroarcula laminariae]
MSTTVEEFLQRKGGVGLLSVLNEAGKTYSEVESEVAITSDTISKRKDEALDIGPIEIQPARRHGRTLNEYHLTDFGEAVAERLAVEGVVSNYHSMRMHQRKVEEGTEEVAEWLTENPNHFQHFPEVTEETLINRTEENESVSASGGRDDVDLPEEVPESTDGEDAEDENGDGRVQHEISDVAEYAKADEASKSDKE